MRNRADYSGWIAEQIAKVYLFETNLVEIYETQDKDFDFLCILKNDFQKSIAVEVKSSQYSKSEILRKYKPLRQNLLQSKIPVIMFYINYIDKTGYIEVLHRELKNKLTVLTTQNLILEIQSINFT